MIKNISRFLFNGDIDVRVASLPVKEFEWVQIPYITPKFMYISRDNHYALQVAALSNQLDLFVRAAEKQEKALKEEGWGHAVWCNFPNNSKVCNCGISDLQFALARYRNSKKI